jgi:hypothetical protein
MSHSQCKKAIIGRYGHWPPFAIISEAKTEQSFLRYHGY